MHECMHACMHRITSTAWAIIKSLAHAPNTFFLIGTVFHIYIDSKREQVMDQNSNDPSIRLVRWVKTRDVGSRPTPQTNTCATRKRRIDPATRNETRDHATGASAGSLAVPIMEMDDTVVDEGACQDATAVHRGLFVSQVLSSDDCLSQWQCLEDAGCRYGFE